jgi:hypothetical protein
MRNTLRALALTLALLPGLAVAQTFPTVPDHTVIGRIGTGSGSGPSQAIPWATLLANIAGTPSANTVYAGPATGAAAQPAFRALVAADLPLPTASTIGGVESITSLAHNWIAYIDTLGVPHQSQPACGDLSNAAASCSTDATNASNIGTGTLNTARLPTPFTNGTPSGNTSSFGTTTGALTSGHCASFDASGNINDSGAICGTASYVLLATLTASNSATLSDTTHLTSSYTTYEILFANILPATNAVSCQLQVHTGGAYVATSYISNVVQVTGASISAGTNTTGIICGGASAVLNTGPGISGIIRISNPSQTTSPKMMIGSLAHPTTGPALYGLTTFGYWNGGNGAVDGFQVIMSSGNITSGTIKIYGIQ